MTMSSSQVLVDAVRARDAYMVHTLLTRCEDIDPRHNESEALVAAVELEDYGIAEMLVADARADPACRDNWPLRHAARHGLAAFVDLLLRGDSVDPAANDNEAICSAAEQGYFTIARMLLEHPTSAADPAARSDYPVRAAIRNGHVGLACYLMDRFPGRVRPTSVGGGGEDGDRAHGAAAESELGARLPSVLGGLEDAADEFGVADVLAMLASVYVGAAIEWYSRADA